MAVGKVETTEACSRSSTTASFTSPTGNDRTPSTTTYSEPNSSTAAPAPGPTDSGPSNSTCTVRSRRRSRRSDPGGAAQQRPLLRMARTDRERVNPPARVRHIEIEQGPVSRNGAKGGGTSVYFRDPDGSLLEFISCQGRSKSVPPTPVEKCPTHGCRRRLKSRPAEGCAGWEAVRLRVGGRLLAQRAVGERSRDAAGAACGSRGSCRFELTARGSVCCEPF